MQVLAELQFALGQMERALQTNPQDRTPHNHIAVLRQVRIVLWILLNSLTPSFSSFESL